MLHHYIDNEVPGFGEWTNIVQNVPSTFVQTNAASFPERGALGARVTISGANVAYGQLNTAISLNGGESLFTGYWFCRLAGPSDWTILDTWHNGTPTHFAYSYMMSGGSFRVRIRTDAGAYTMVAYSAALALNRWYYVVWEIRRAVTNVSADGGGAIWIDGSLIGSNYAVDNYDRAPITSKLIHGVTGVARDGFSADFDEVKVADAYPEPYRPWQQGSVLSAPQPAITPAVIGAHLLMRK